MKKLVIVLRNKEYKRIAKAAKRAGQAPAEFVYRQAEQAAHAMKRGEMGFKVKA